SACALETTPREPVGRLERGHACLLRLPQEHSHRLLDPGGAAASLGRLVPLQLERHVDDAAGICDEVGRIENALGGKVVRKALMGEDVVCRAADDPALEQ